MGKGRNKGQKMRLERRRKQNNAVSQNARKEISFNKYLSLSKYYMSGFMPDAGDTAVSSALRVPSLLRGVDKQHEALQRVQDNVNREKTIIRTLNQMNSFEKEVGDLMPKGE